MSVQQCSQAVKICFDSATQTWLVQCCCWMIHREVDEIVDLAGLAVDDGDFLVGEGTIHGMASERDDDLRIDDLNLLIQERCTHSDLFDERVAIARGTALDHVGDINRAAIDTGFLQQLIQESARRADKGDALLVFVETGALADNYPGGPALQAVAGHGFHQSEAGYLPAVRVPVHHQIGLDKDTVATADNGAQLTDGRRDGSVKALFDPTECDPRHG